jgi:transposase
MGFGWLDGCGSVASRPSSCIRRASRYRASPAEPRRIGSILRCSSACFWDGCAASRVTAKWWRSPTLEEEDARRPSREREILVGERTRIINRMKAALVRLGIRGFKPGLLTAPQKLDALRTPEETPIPPNMVDEMRRDMARLAWVREQIKAIEQARLERLERAPGTGRHAMVRMLARVIGVGVEASFARWRKGR